MGSTNSLHERCCTTSPNESVKIHNRAGLDELAYRVGTHGRFKESMGKSITDYPALRPLTTRDDSDGTMALIDSWAVVLDVLTFYQERIANEGFLRTCTERRSTLELARAIGYELNPGVAASTYSVFNLETATGSPENVRLDPGLKIQSIPGQDETPQIFETVESLMAYTTLNEVKPQCEKQTVIRRSTLSIYVEGTSHNLEKGQRILLVGKRRETSLFSERWDVRTITEVEELHDDNKTRIQWIEELGHTSPRVDPADEPRLFVFRKKASLFGYNAPDFKAMPDSIKEAYDPNGTSRTQWPDFRNQTVGDNRIDLDAEYPGIIEGSWVLLEKTNYVELYRVVEVLTNSRTDYTLTAKVTSLILDVRKHLSWFGLRNSTVFADSVELIPAQEPVTKPVYGITIDLDGYYPELEAGRRMIFEAIPLSQVQIAPRSRTYKSDSRELEEKEQPLLLRHHSSTLTRTLATGETLNVSSAPFALSTGRTRWSLSTDDGFAGYLDADENDLLFPETKEDEKTSAEHEIVIVGSHETTSEGLSRITLESPLAGVYVRNSVVLYGNVVAVSHGETKTEVIGSGDQSQPMQSFQLFQTPLTYISSAAAGGAESTLNIRVNGIEWNEVESLYGQPSDAQVYQTRAADDGTVSVQFGDNSFGSRLPTARDAVSATYRVGIGMEGMVRENQLSLLMTRPLGVKDTTNPLRATGAQDPETIEEAKINAPRTVLTMDRIVSVQDFEDFARSFAGIGKARASLIWNGYNRIVHLTIAGSDGLPVETDSTLYTNLMTSLDTMRHNDYPVFVDSLIEITFTLAAVIRLNPRYEPEKVLASVKTLLTERYSFKNRSLGGPVTVSELVSVIHQEDGVEGVTLTDLNGNDPVTHPMIPASDARWDEDLKIVIPAELLIIDPNGIQLTEGTS